MVQANRFVLAEDFILRVAAETGKDYSHVIYELQDNEIELIDDLFRLQPADFSALGFSIALKNRVMALKEQY